MKKVLTDGSALRKRLIFIILIGVVLGTWYLFFSYEVCWDKGCFDKNLRECNRARFINGEDMVFEYFINGENGDSCEVKVELLQGDLDNSDSLKLEGYTMVCMLPLGVAISPESDIGACHGLLKEGLQDLVIQKLHTYLVQNLGRLNLEMADLPKDI